MPVQLARIKRRLFEILGLLLLAIPLATVLWLYDLAGKVIYFKYGEKRWSEARPGKCSANRKKLVYADMRPGHSREHPLELSCEQGLTLPANSQYALSPDGLKIHYKLFTGHPGQPLLLYVPGLTSTWLDGARFQPLAQRLGFQLAVMEMRNHGVSGNDGKGAGYGCREHQDVLAVLNALLKSNPQRPVYLWGTSMGTAAILNAAPALQQLPQVKAIVLENPSPALRQVVERLSPGYPGLLYDSITAMASWRSGLDFKACDPQRMAAQLQQPVLVTVAKADQMTPVAQVSSIYQALPASAKSQFKVYPHGDHAAVWNGQPQQYERDLLSFWQASQGP